MVRTLEVQKILVRLPVDVKQWLEAECTRNLTSYSSQLTLILRANMGDQEKAKAPAYTAAGISRLTSNS